MLLQSDSEKGLFGFLLPFLSIDDIRTCRLVCKSWNTSSTEEGGIWEDFFQRDFISPNILQLRSQLQCQELPNCIVWHSCIEKLKKITQESRLQQLMSPEDQENLYSSISVLLHIPLCRTYIGFPDQTIQNTLQECFTNPPKIQFTHKELFSFLIRHNVSTINISKKLRKMTTITRKFGEAELLLCLTSCLKGKLRVQFYVLKEIFEYLFGIVNALALKMEVIIRYPALFAVFQKKKEENEVADRSWILLVSQLRFVVTDKPSLKEAVYNILWEHPKGIRIKAFRDKFERCTGLPFGLCVNKSLLKYLDTFCHEILVSASKIFLIERMK